jgi:hypothetical protein
MILTIEFKI